MNGMMLIQVCYMNITDSSCLFLGFWLCRRPNLAHVDMMIADRGMSPSCLGQLLGMWLLCRRRSLPAKSALAVNISHGRRQVLLWAYFSSSRDLANARGSEIQSSAGTVKSGIHPEKFPEATLMSLGVS